MTGPAGQREKMQAYSLSLLEGSAAPPTAAQEVALRQVSRAPRVLPLLLPAQLLALRTQFSTVLCSLCCVVRCYIHQLDITPRRCPASCSRSRPTSLSRPHRAETGHVTCPISLSFLLFTPYFSSRHSALLSNTTALHRTPPPYIHRRVYVRPLSTRC